MAAISYNRIRLNLVCPWNLYGVTQSTYSHMFVLSGAAPLPDQAASEATALDCFFPISQLSNSGAELASYSYYPPNAHAARDHVAYAAGTHPCHGTAFGTPNQQQQQAEVCILCEGPTDKNSRGKQVYLRKWIHWVSSDGNGNTHPALVLTTVLDKWKNGCGPNLLVPIDSDSGTQASTWTINPHLFTRQFRKGKKRKVTTKDIFVPVPVP